MKKLSVVFSLFCLPLIAQMNEAEVKSMIKNTDESQLVIESSRFLQENFFHFADLVTDKLLLFDAKNGNYNYRKGFILLGMNKSPEVALKHLEIASAKTEINYDIYSPNETSAPKDVYYYLGVCHHRLGNLDKAISYINQFISESQKGSTLLPLATIRLNQLNAAKKLSDKPNAGIALAEINTIFNETAPLISADGKSLTYSSSKPLSNNSSAAYVEPMFNELPSDIYQLVMNRTGTWSSTTGFAANDDKTDEIISGISMNERSFCYSSWNDPNVYYSEFSNGTFSKGKALSFTVNNGKEKTAPYHTQLTISADGKTAYFVSNALSGKGGWDIFTSEKIGDSWSEATNIAMINTEADEMSPFISLDGKTLYFASNSGASIGGYDIFKATKDENGMWSKPTNLGTSVNSFSDEVNFSLTANGTTGYVASNRVGSIGLYDIYQVSPSETPSGLAVLNGRIVNTKGNPIPEQSYITIRCTNCSNTTEVLLSPRMRDGVFISSLEKCKEYELAYYYGPLTKKPYKNKFNTSCNNEFELISKKVLIIDEDSKIIPFPSYEIKGVVVDIETGNPIENAVVNLSIDGKGDKVYTGNNGLYHSELIASYEYESHVAGDLMVNAEGYLSSSAKVNSDLLDDSVVTVNFKLEATQKGFIGPYFVNYQFDRYHLTDYSKNKLKEVIKVMNDNPSLSIEIRSHTDSRGSKAYNQRLSEMRANTAMEYIKGFVVNPERISAKGYGETELLKPCGDGVSCSNEDHLANRRTEFIIMK
ncbi:MAG: OmpA family protein [Flavobacteriales bacterium]